MASFYYGRIPFDPTINNGVLSHEMRAIWSNNAIWTRDYITAAMAGSPDKEAIGKRLMYNQNVIGKTFQTFFSNNLESAQPIYQDNGVLNLDYFNVGQYIQGLMEQYTVSVSHCLTAIKSNDPDALRQRSLETQAIIHKIAQYLWAINHKYWPYRKSKDFLQNMFDLTMQGAIERKNSEWKKEINTFDKLMVQTLMFADYLSDGIQRRQRDLSRYITKFNAWY